MFTVDSRRGPALVRADREPGHGWDAVFGDAAVRAVSA